MANIFYSLLLTVFYVVIVQIDGQDYCTPNPVQNIALSEDAILSWNPPSNDDCTIAHYLLFIMSGPEGEMFYIVEETRMDVSFLPICTDITVTIIPVSEYNINGIYTLLYTRTPAPSDLNLTLTYFSLSQLPNNGVRLEWNLDPQFEKCLTEYRVVFYNEDDDQVTSIYTLFNSETRTNLIPCTSYVFTATALYNLQTEGPISLIRYMSPSVKISPPTVESINMGTTTADLRWSLPGPSINRCPVTALIVDGSPYFNISYPISGQNQINRPPVNVRLTSLQSDTMYVLHVFANNSAGFSDPFIIAVQTLGSN